jgi:ABC-2 type transport system ATP-binding protein
LPDVSEAVIRVEGLRKVFKRSFWGRETEAVADVSFAIGRGEVWAFVGPNGAGKSTTMYCLLGILKPSAGTVSVFGDEPGSLSVRRRLGFQSEIFHCYPYLTAEQALTFYGRLAGMPADILRERASSLLQRVGLGAERSRRIGGFSKGMMQRLGLAQSVLNDPDLLIWDEPTTGLDPEGRLLVMELAREFRDRGKTVLLSTHILSDIERVCTHILFINRGRILKAESVPALLAANPAGTLEGMYMQLIGTGEHAR